MFSNLGAKKEEIQFCNMGTTLLCIILSICILKANGSGYSHSYNITSNSGKVCPSDWKLIGDRCIYNSYDFNDNVHTWNEASSRCRSLLDGATLASIRNEADQHAFNSNNIIDVPQLDYIA